MYPFIEHINNSCRCDIFSLDVLRNWFLFHFFFGFIRKSMLLFCISISCTLIKRNIFFHHHRHWFEETRKGARKHWFVASQNICMIGVVTERVKSFVLHKNYIFRFLNVLQSHRKTLSSTLPYERLYFFHHVSEGHSRHTCVTHAHFAHPSASILIALKCK